MSTNPAKEPDSPDQVAPRSVWRAAAPFIVATGVIAGFVGLFAGFTLLQNPEPQDPYADVYAAPDRDLALVPFDITDATWFCEQKTRKKYGDQLALTYVDEHSTRLDKRTGLYKIFMVAHVGDLNQYEETAVHCFVDQYRHNLAHYRTIEPKNSFISRAMRFFN